MTSLRWLFPILFAILSACSASKGFDRAGIQESLHQQLDFAGGREATHPTTINPSLAESLHLGIYFIRREFPARQSIQTMEWLSADKDAVVQHLAPLRKDKIVREVTVLAEPTALTLTRQELRQASARFGIDVLLLVDGVGAVDRYNNAYALLYSTVLGAWLAPGTVIDALFILTSRLWDLRTDQLLDQQTAEGQAHRTGAVVLMDNTETLKEAKGRAIDIFGEIAVSRLRSLTTKQAGNSSSLR